MEKLGRPRGLVMHGGETLWAQLDALAQWGDHLQCVRLVLAYGDDEPGGPADRLERFVSANLPHITVERTTLVHDDDPGQTALAIEKATQGADPWLVDVSGGTRLMFAGGVLAASRLPHVRVVFRDPDGPWYQVEPSGTARLLEGASTRALERFTVQGLLEVTWADHQRQVEIISPTIEAEINNAAARLLRHPTTYWQKDFHQALKELRGRGLRAKSGLMFERFVLSILRQLGVEDDDTAIGVTLQHGKEQLQEVDVVVNCDGWLHVIDCKLTDGDSKYRTTRRQVASIGTQVREAYATRRLIGDGGDQFILLRPNLTIGHEFRSLCAEYGVIAVDKTVLTKDSLPHVLGRLVHPPGYEEWAARSAR